MKAKEIKEQFCQKIATILSYKEDARQLARTRRQALTKYLAREAKENRKESEILSSMSMSYRNARSGEDVRYGRIRRNVLDEILSLDLHQNKQYQWLLAEAYEEFEDFLEMMYACAGWADKSFWPLVHYGQITLDEISGKDWDWHLNQVRRPESRITPDLILRRFRQKLPGFATTENTNALNVDLRFFVALITQLRHHVVHTAGRVRQREEFSKKVLDGIGRWNNGRPSEYRDEIDSFFFEPPHDEVIALLEYPLKENQWIPTYMDVMQNLCRHLLSTADLLTHFLEEHQTRVRMEAARADENWPPVFPY